MNEDSSSDWDSMSESGSAHQRNEGQKYLKGSTESQLNSNEPPFDFSSEVPKSSSKSSPKFPDPPGRDQPKVVEAYRPTHSGKMVPKLTRLSRFQSPGEDSIVSSKGSSHLKTNGENTPTGSVETVRHNTTNKATPGTTTSSGSCQSSNGIVNAGFNPDTSFDIEEKADADVSDKMDQNFYCKTQHPAPDERIQLWKFSSPASDYLQVDLGQHGEVLGDRLLPDVSQALICCLSETFGILKIPFIVVFIALGQVIKFLLDAIVQPASDFILKPLLVSIHNLIISPFCGLAFNFCRLSSHALYPCRKLCKSEKTFVC